jgi:hypothetical protein
MFEEVSMNRIATRSLRVLSLLAAILTLTFAVHATLPLVQTGTWQPAGAMVESRSGAASALLADGRLLLIGGTANGHALASAEAFGAGGGFSAIAAMNEERSGHSATVLLDGRVLVAGGANDGGVTASAEVYDPASGSWSSAGVLGVARSGHSATRLEDGRVLIAGGEGAAGPVASLEIYDPETNAFHAAGSLGAARAGHAAALLKDGSVLIAGGHTADGDGNAVALASVEIVAAATGTASGAASLSTPRNSLTATTLLDGRVFVAGGNDGANDLASAEVYDPATGSWSAAASMASARSGHMAFLLPDNNSVLLVGGSAAGADLASAELYQPWNDAVKATGAMSAPRPGASGSAIGAEGLLLVAGGAGQGTAELYRYATVYTDADDYAPGTTVYISGSGWKPLEVVTLSLREFPSQEPHEDWVTIADDQGNINDFSWAPDETDLNQRFYLTAKGEESEAQNTFTDSHVIDSVTLNGASSVTVAPSTSITAAVSATFTGSGNNTTWRSTAYTIGALATVCVDTPDHSVNGTFTESFSITAPATAGSYNVTFQTFAGNSCNSTSSPTFTLTGGIVVKLSQTITFTNPGTKTFGDADFALSASASPSGLPVSFASQTPAVCTVSGSTAHIVSAGSCTIRASQAGNDTYFAAPDVDRTFTINAANQTITFNALADKTYGDADFGVTASASSGLAVTFSSTTTGVCTVSGVTVHIVSAGGCTIRASQAGNGNYNAAPDVDGSFTVAQKAATWTTNPASKTYGDPDPAPLTTGSGSGFLPADSVTATYTRAAGETVGGSPYHITATLSPAGVLGNYIITNNGADFTINKKTVTPHVTASSKTYDGNATASITACAVTTVVGLDDVACSAGSASFNDKNVATGKTVTATGITLTGTTAGNYQLSSTSATTTADISALHITGNFTAGSKTYDGNDSATVLTRTLNGVLAGDVGNVSLTGGAAHFSDKNVATGKTVTLTGATLSGTESGNYALDSVATTTADINALHLTGSFTADNKTYDGNDSATVLTRALHTPVAGDDVSLSGGTAHFSDANASNGKTVTLTGATLAGADAGNYLLDSVATTTADIYKANATVHVSGYSGTYDGNPHGASGTATGVGGADLSSFLNLGASFTDVPGGTAHWTFNAGGNYETAEGDVSIVISKAPSTTTVSGGGSFVYDGLAHPASVSVTGAGGLSLSPAPVYSGACSAAPVNVAETPCTAGYDYPGDGNHLGSSDSTVIHITRKPASVAPNPKAKVYGQADPALDGTLSGFVAADGISATYARTAGEDVSGSPYTISATLAPAGKLANYNITYNTAAFTITKANTTVTLGVTPAANNGPGSYILNTPQTFTVTVNPQYSGTPAGTVTLKDGATTIATIPLSGGSGSISNSTLVSAILGAHDLSAVYNGDGNFNTSSSATNSFTVGYTAGGLCLGSPGHQILQPINADGTSVSKQGSTVPAKFRVCDANGNSIGAPGTVSSFNLIQVISGTVVSEVTESVDSTTPDTMFRWSATDQQWIYNISTKNYQKNKTYVFLITLNDGSRIQFQFGLK